MVNNNQSQEKQNLNQLQDGSNNWQQSFKVNKKGFIEVDGEVEELLPGLKFRVILDNGHEIIATLAGRMRINKITLVLGDKIRVEISPYDLTKGRIVYRY